MTKFSVWNRSAVCGYVPAGAPAGKTTVVVTSQGGLASNPIAFYVGIPVNPTPQVSGLWPQVGGAGTVVTVLGNNFGSSPSVSFGGVVGTVDTVNSAGSFLIATVPTGATTGPVVVTNGPMSSSHPPDLIFNYTTTHSVDKLSPNNGIAGTVVQIDGANLGASGTVTFHGAAAVTPTSWGVRRIVVTVPTGATTGPIVVTPSGGSAITGPSFAIQFLAANCNGWGSSTFADGCAGAPQPSRYTVQHPDFFSGYALQSGQTYVSTGGCKGNANCHPPWAVAGVDYPVGPSTEGCTNPSLATCGPGVCAQMNATTPGSCTAQTNVGFGNPGSATDPTQLSSPNWHGLGSTCTANNGWGGAYIICQASTTAAVDIGPFDFTSKGNASGVGPGFVLQGANAQPCTIHDTIFEFTQSASAKPSGTAQHNGSVAYTWTGCSALTLKYDTFSTRERWSGIRDWWIVGGNGNYPPGNIFLGGPYPSQGPAWDRLITIQYSSFVTCPTRCGGMNSNNLSYNYFEGVNTMSWGHGLAHGDGWMAIFYNGPYGFNPSVSACNCSGIQGFTEKFDTWLQPSWGRGNTSCITCALVNSPGPHTAHFSATAGSNIVTLTGNSGEKVPDNAQPNIGFWQAGSAATDFFSHGGAGTAPYTYPVITGCPSTGCGTDGQYTMSVPWPATVSGGMGWGFPASVTSADYENNVYVVNRQLPPAGFKSDGESNGHLVGNMSQIGSAMWAGYGVYQNVTVNNNYLDSCGYSWASWGPAPTFYCIPPAQGTIGTLQTALGGGKGTVTQLQENNVLMTTGGCFEPFGAGAANTPESQCRSERREPNGRR
jgi:hypothetical protein